MSIKKFVSIQNVGRLANSAQKGPELSRYNLFFAENGRGKTTLCSILRSLETGQHEHITERKTISPTAGEPTAVIRLDGSEARYQKGAWNKVVPQIAIFDATFVAQNVHAGEYVSREHRTNLLQIFIGEAGVTLAKKVNELDSAIREKNSHKNRAGKAVEALLPNGVKIDDFLDLTEDPETEKKIKSKAAELKTAQDADGIKKKAALTQVSVPALPENILPTLKKTLDDVSSDAEKRLKEQIARHEMHDKGEAWLSQGVDYVKDDVCPFCGQKTKGLELVEAYKQYFSESYATLMTEIDQASRDLSSNLGDSAFTSISRTMSANEAGAEFWKNHVAAILTDIDYESQIATPAISLRKATQALIDKKLARPLEPVVEDSPFKTAVEEYQKAINRLAAYNESLAAINKLIENKKTEAESADVPKIEKELAVLKLTQKRFDKKIKPLCDDYQELVVAKAQLDKDKEAAKEALDVHSDKMIEDYQATINTLLKGFGAGFKITNSKKTYLGGTPASVYQILINNHAVDIGDVTTPLGERSFRTTLSAGDKSTLALALFLAKLEHDPNKANRIIVFDDPFNSQDRSRRERTAELLKKYGSECHQMILLSHDPYFLNLVFSKLPKNERHCLQLSRVPDNNTTIEEWDIEKETQEGYFREHAALNSYLLYGTKDLIDMARKIRPVLEGYLRYRFPNQFPDTEWLGGMISYIRKQGSTHPMHAALEELEGINDYSKKYHHDTNPGKADAEGIDDGELTAFVQRTLAIAGGY
jgi:wobble nucleotide-excising tRNase